MDSVQALEEALAVAKRLGFDVREDSLSGAGGACRIRGRKFLYLELNSSVRERLDQVLVALRAEPDLERLGVSPMLRRLLQLDRAA
jgi:hypothetical protein